MSPPLKTIQEVREDFSRKGLTIRQWAMQKGVNEKTVYAVIEGLNKGKYGAAHEVAVLLGLKEGNLNDAC